MSAFTKGLGIFWRTELRVVAFPLAMIISAVVMATAFILAFAGLAWGVLAISCPCAHILEHRMGLSWIGGVGADAHRVCAGSAHYAARQGSG